MNFILPSSDCAGDKAQAGTGVQINHDPACLVDYLKSKEDLIVGVDVETVGCNPSSQSSVGNGRVVCWSLAFIEPGTETTWRYFLWADALTEFKDWLENPKYKKVGHNFFSYDRHIFANHGINVQGIVGDTMHMARFLKTDKNFSVGLKSLMKLVFGYELGGYKELFSRPSFTGKKNFRDKIGKSKRGGIPTVLGTESWNVSFKTTELIPLDEIKSKYPSRLNTLYDYASLDAKATIELYFKLVKALKRKKLLSLYEEFWNPSLYVLNDIERRGIKLNPTKARMAGLDAHLAARAAKILLQSWSDGLGGPDNWDSNAQISTYLYKELDWPIPPVCGSRKAVKINYDKKETVDWGAVNYWRTHLSGEGDRRACEHLLNYRAARDDAKRLEKLVDYLGTDRRLHSVLAPSTDTGRLSSRNPSLHQICAASRDKFGLRKAFIPRNGCSFIVSDFSQLELYILAFILQTNFQDSRLSDGLKSGDIHTYVAKLAWPNELKDIRGNLKFHADPTVQKRRDDVKAVIYGINYGKSAAGLGASITDLAGKAIGKEAAKELIQTIVSSTGIDKYQKWIIEKARQDKGVYTLAGRFRPLTNINSRDWRLKKADERKALNTPLQGSAADIVTEAMLKCNTLDMPELRDRGWYNETLARLRCDMVLQIHDELVFEVPDICALNAREEVHSVMESVSSCGLKANTVICSDWAGGK